MRVKKVIKNVKITLLLAKYEGKVSDKKNVKIGLLLAKYEGKESDKKSYNSFIAG